MLNLVVIRVTDLERSHIFYSALGLNFSKEQHGAGPEHLAAQTGQVVFEIYPSRGSLETLGVRLGFTVTSVQSTIAAAELAGGKVLTSPKVTGQFEHESVGLAACSFCGEQALYYSADVYDDVWQYWCLLDGVEKAILLSVDKSSNPQLAKRASDILRKYPTLINHPVRGLLWAMDGAQAIQGAPW